MTKKIICFLLISATLFSSYSHTASVKADTSTVVTIGSDLSDPQKEKMYEYFGITKTSVPILEVTNDDERKYLEGIATSTQIGRKTYSCAYIEPTTKGSGIKVKLANLTWVTSNMIASTLSTAGIYDCNVVAAAPFAVSGTGALTGVYLALDSLGYELSEEKKELASEELIITGNLAEEIGSDEATGIIADIKNTIIAENIVVADQIETVIIDSSEKYEVTLTDEQVETILSTMQKIAKQDYDYSRMQHTLESITEKTSEKLGLVVNQISESSFLKNLSDFFSRMFRWVKDLFSKAETTEVSPDESDTQGILSETNDSLLGDDIIIDSTDEPLNPIHPEDIEETKTESDITTE